MNRNMHNRVGTSARNNMLIVAIVPLIGLAGVAAQENAPTVPGNIPSAEAHLHNSDMSCCAPCAPEGNQDPDVFRRPCFLRALGKSLKGGQSSAGLMSPDGMKVPVQQTASADVQGFQNLLSSVLQPAFQPQAWDEVKFHIPYPLKRAVVELRSGVKTFVGHEPDTAAEVNELKKGDAIQAGWSVEGIDVLPRMLYGQNPPKYASIRLRLHGDERLVLKPRPGDFDEPGGRRKFFDSAAFHNLLTKVFRAPFDSSEDWFTDGYDTTYEGVRVFHGQIVSRKWGIPRRASNTDQTPPHWWDQMALLVTDSDPQYFCVSIVLGRDDVIPAPQP